MHTRVLISTPLSYRLKIARPIHRNIQCHSFVSQETIRLVGHSVTLFVGFYCGLQWLHYRDLRKQVEDRSKREDHSKSEDHSKREDREDHKKDRKEE